LERINKTFFVMARLDRATQPPRVGAANEFDARLDGSLLRAMTNKVFQSNQKRRYTVRDGRPLTFGRLVFRQKLGSFRKNEVFARLHV
jgi:hypothetical protein